MYEEEKTGSVRENPNEQAILVEVKLCADECVNTSSRILVRPLRTSISLMQARPLLPHTPVHLFTHKTSVLQKQL